MHLHWLLIASIVSTAHFELGKPKLSTVKSSKLSIQLVPRQLKYQSSNDFDFLLDFLSVLIEMTVCTVIPNNFILLRNQLIQ